MQDTNTLNELAHLGANITASREARGMSKAELAGHIPELSSRMLQRWESGERVPSLQQLIALARVLGVSVPTLLSEPASSARLVARFNEILRQVENVHPPLTLRHEIAHELDMKTNELVRALEHPRTVNFDTMVRVCELLGANYRWLETDTQAPFKQTRALIDASALSKHIIQQDYIELYIARVPEHRALVFVRSTPWRFVHIAQLDTTRCERCVEHVKAIMYIDVRWATLDRSQHRQLASGSIYPGTFFVHEMVAV